MFIEQKINALVQVSTILQDNNSDRISSLIEEAKMKNPWFSQENIRLALSGICTQYLNENKLKRWLSNYPIEAKKTPRKIGTVMAGNIPAVGFHDFLSVLLSGHILYAKLSSEDNVLLKAIAQILVEIEPFFADKIFFVEKLNEADAYIATGSNNSARYFHYYFAKKPHVIRKNRNSCAVLNGRENVEDLQNLGKDIFQYFGLGCRSVSKLYVPEKYNFNSFFEANQLWQPIIHQHKYLNNYEYNKAVYLVNSVTHLDNGFLLLSPNGGIASPVAVLYYENYNHPQELKEKLDLQKEQIQVIVSKDAWFPESINLGKAQEPELWNYADGIDTMQFLINL